MPKKLVAIDGHVFDTDLITADESRALATALAAGEGWSAQAPVTEDVATKKLTHVAEWAQETKIGTYLLELVLSGNVLISVDDNGKIMFHSTKTL